MIESLKLPDDSRVMDYGLRKDIIKVIFIHEVKARF